LHFPGAIILCISAHLSASSKPVEFAGVPALRSFPREDAKEKTFHGFRAARRGMKSCCEVSPCYAMPDGKQLLTTLSASSQLFLDWKPIIGVEFHLVSIRGFRLGTI